MAPSRRAAGAALVLAGALAMAAAAGENDRTRREHAAVVAELMVRAGAEGSAEFVPLHTLTAGSVVEVAGTMSAEDHPPQNAVDGDLKTVYVEHAHAPLRVDLASPLPWCSDDNTDASCEYAFAFAPASTPVSGAEVDAPGHDPIEYHVSVSADGEVWSTVSISHASHAPAIDAAAAAAHSRATPYLRAVGAGEVPVGARDAVLVPVARFLAEENRDVVPGIRHVSVEVVTVRAEAYGPHADIPAGTTVVEHVMCEGGTVMFQGMPQQACEIPENLCRKVCERMPSCMLYTYEPQDSCCALKYYCNDHRRRWGRHATIVRHDTYNPRRPLKEPGQVFSMYLRDHPEANATALLDALAEAFVEDGNDEQAAAFEAVLTEWLAAAPEGRATDAPAGAAALPFFAFPQRMPSRTHEQMERDLDPPQQHR